MILEPEPGRTGMTPRKTKTSSLADRLMERLKLRTATVSVVGLGYVGLPLAETFAASGFTVIGFDIDDEKIARLKAGESYIKAHLVAAASATCATTAASAPHSTRRLSKKPTRSSSVCRPADRDPPGRTCRSSSTGRMLKDHLKRGQLIVLESTTYPGTTEDLLKPILEESG